jgi:antitoxin MazE
MQVAKWGNSLAVRLPKTVVEALSLRPGDDIEISITGPREMQVRRAPSRAELMERLRQQRGTLPPGFVWDRRDAHDSHDG